MSGLEISVVERIDWKYDLCECLYYVHWIGSTFMQIIKKYWYQLLIYLMCNTKSASVSHKELYYSNRILYLQKFVFFYTRHVDTSLSSVICHVCIFLFFKISDFFQNSWVLYFVIHIALSYLQFRILTFKIVFIIWNHLKAYIVSDICIFCGCIGLKKKIRNFIAFKVCFISFYRFFKY